MCHIVLIIKVYFNLILIRNILKHKTLPTHFKLMVPDKGPYSQSYVFFPVVKYGSKSWPIKKAEHWRTYTFESWCGRRVSWTSKRSDQLILKEINPEYSLERLMLKLKLQYFSYLMWRADSLEKTLMLGKTESKRSEQQRMMWLDSNTDSMDMDSRKFWERVEDRGAWCLQSMGLPKVRHDWACTHDLW